MIKLQWVGWQENGFGDRFKLWNIYGADQAKHPDGSTISIETLQKLGIIQKDAGVSE